MGTVTILNNTNAPINTCISAGVNYSWCNQLSPGEYYVHEGGPGGVFTLNARYWLGADSEYSQGEWDVGLFAAGLVIGVVGMLLVPFTGGSSGIVILGAIFGSGGLAVTGLVVVAKDFMDSPSTLMNIQASQNRKFIAEGHVDISIDNGQAKYKDLPQITLSEPTDDEFKALLRDKGFVKQGEQPISGSYLTKRELDKAGVLNTQIKIRSSRGGTACWEVEDDQLKDDAPLQLWVRDTDKVNWTIESINLSEECDMFTICNKSLNRYAGIKQEGPNEEITDDIRRTLTSKEKDSGGLKLQSFHIVRSRGSYVFIPVNSVGRLVVISEDGNFGNSTKLLLERLNTNNPSWARWHLTPQFGSANKYLTKEELEKANVLGKPVRIRSSRGGTACWEVEDDQLKDDAPLQLWVRDTDKVNWTIESIGNSEDSTQFTICNKSLGRYATIKTQDNNHRMTSQKKMAGGNAQSFHIIYFLDTYAFIPTDHPDLVVISENGNFGNSTKLLLDRLDGSHSEWASWYIFPTK